MEPILFQTLVTLLFLAAGLTFAFTGQVVAPYGRHTRSGFGPSVDLRIGWILMESPSLWVFLLAFTAGPRNHDPIPGVFAALWLAHYVPRTLVYPFRARPSARSIPWAIVGSGFAFNVLNAYVNARSLVAFGPEYGTDILLRFHFWYGLVVFVSGFAINRLSDRTLRRLRKPGESGYKIPHGGLFDFVSCPNYLGEIVQWFGWAIMTWSPAGLAFAVFTAANLVPRAVAHHRWYARTFPNYPQKRRALVPFMF